MEIVYNDADLRATCADAVKVSNDSPVLLDRFLDHAIEVDVDAIPTATQVLIGGIMEHIEQAGVHSGDSGLLAAAVQPVARDPGSLREQTRDGARPQGRRPDEHAVRDPGRDGVIYVLEVNPRASRTVPFVSKATGVRWPRSPRAAWSGISLKEQGIGQRKRVPAYYSVKEAVFPFAKFQDVDPILGPEMKSTGEVMGVGRTFGEAFAKAQDRPPASRCRHAGKAFVSVRERTSPRAARTCEASCVRRAFA
jgi:carbamoyl-phosphate synthase large subunit